jgi:hypothetical protein
MTFAPVFGGTFIENRARAVFPPQAGNPEGEVHEDFGIFSFDRPRKTVVFRQFHVESFVNQYVLTRISEDGCEMVFESEAIENIRPGFRARTTYTLEGSDVLHSRFELAEPSAEYALYSENHLRRKTDIQQGS